MKKLLLGAFTAVVLSLTVGSSGSASAAVTEGGIDIEQYPTYVSLSTSTYSRVGSSASITWEASHSGGDGVYYATMYYGDGSRSSGTFYSTRSSWPKTYSLAPTETQRSWTAQIVVSSTDVATDSKTFTLRRW